MFSSEGRLKSPEKTHELVRLKNGEMSLAHLASGEVMHSNVGPRAEATLLYVEQSRLKERLAEASDACLVVYDVGLGAGTNALAALHACRQGARRPLELHSFETDLSGLRLSLENKEHFPFFDGETEAAARELLETGSWRSRDRQACWKLWQGDFRDWIQGKQAQTPPKPEILYYDFYSTKVNPELWGTQVFASIRRHAAPSAQLFTYSASTRIRVALLLAGFYVGYGRSTGAKRETTVAATWLGGLENPLDARWLSRFKASDQPFPYDWVGGSRAELSEQVLQHLQWAGEGQERQD